MGMPTATVRLKGPDGKVHLQASMGSGPVDATYKAIRAIINVPNKLLEFNVHAITEGIDALGEVTVRIQAKDGEQKTMDAQKEIPYSRVFGGHGADTDIIVASAKAYINALNKLIIAQTEGLNPVHANHMHGVMLG
jgi:2-isopropylmalate synthase